jgi:pimeloyl-ACP methyl ester carboxylesterase
VPEESQAQDRYVRANGLRFHYRQWGAASAPGLLILHSLAGQSWEWDPLAAALADRYRVVALDQRGHGASDWAADRDYAPERMADDLAALVAALGLDRVSLVGHSMGAINGYLLAGRQPALVDRLVILDVGPDSLSSAWVLNTIPPALREWSQAAYPDREQLLAEWCAASPQADPLALRRFLIPNLRQREDGQWVWRFDAAGLQSYFERAPDPAVQWAALRRVAGSTLVVRAAHSAVLSAATAERMARELPQARLTVLPEAGHDLHIDQPEALLAAVRDFLTAP